MSDRPRPIVTRFPELARVSFMNLANAPTAVERSPVLEAFTGHDRVYVKRDDRISDLYGGNKVRRFEYLFADAKTKGKKTLVTVGGLASTQVMATILHGKRAGFDVVAVLFDQPVTSFAREALAIDRAFGGELVRGGGYLGTALRTVAAYRSAKDPYLILPGASNAPAVMSYVDATLELGEQVARGEMPRPDAIVTACGSGGTLAGIAIGCAVLGWPTIAIGVRITDLLACNKVTIGFLIRGTRRWIERRAPSFPRDLSPRFEIFHGAIGEGYGYATPDAVEAIPIVKAALGVDGEVTYSGKALAGLRAIASAKRFETLLYWATLSSEKPKLDRALPPRGFERYFEGETRV